MWRIHCNKCHRRRDPEVEVIFHITDCKHVLCTSCLNESSPEKRCVICNLGHRAVPITRDLPRNVANYFEDPIKFLELYLKVSKFQSQQRALENLGFYRRMQEHEKDKLQLEGYCKLEEQLNQKIQEEKKRIADMRAYIEHNKTKSKERRPRTPSVLTSDNTQSDETMASFYMEFDMDHPGKDPPCRSGKIY